MIKVVINKKQEIAPEDVTPDYFIGVNRSGEKGFVTRQNYDDGNYKVLSPCELTKGNGWSFYDGKTLPTLLNTLINNKFDVFVFDTSKELFTWLAKE